MTDLIAPSFFCRARTQTSRNLYLRRISIQAELLAADCRRRLSRVASRVVHHGSRMARHGSRMTCHGAVSAHHWSHLACNPFRIASHGPRIACNRSRIAWHRSRVAPLCFFLRFLLCWFCFSSSLLALLVLLFFCCAFFASFFASLVYFALVLTPLRFAFRFA